MEDITPAPSALDVICSIFAGATACTGTAADARACDHVPAAYVFTLQAREAAERAALEAALEVVTRRLQGPDLCSLEATLRDDGSMVLRVVSLAEEATIPAPLLAPGVVGFYAVDETRDPTQISPGYAVFPDRDGAPVLMKWDSLLPPDPIADASAVDGQIGWVVAVSLTTEAARAFGEVTAALLGRPLAIVIDNVVVTAPRIQEPILGGRFHISGSGDRDEATVLAAVLRAGRLPDGVALELAGIDVEPRDAR